MFDKSSWNEIPSGSPMEGVSRQLFYGKNIMLARIESEKGATLKKHSHHHEQMVYNVEGEMKFVIGNDGEETEIVLKAGDVLLIPSNVPHGTVALTDKVLAFDIFSPIREDFLK